MANFLISYNKTNINEGGYANDPADHGGETWGGIARKFWPQWEGWPIIDSYKKLPGFPSQLSRDERLGQLKKDFYRSHFWNPLRGDEILVQQEADMMYDDAVNAGTQPAIKKAQNVLFALPEDQKERDKKIASIGIAYGKMDNKTLDKLNLRA